MFQNNREQSHRIGHYLHVGRRESRHFLAHTICKSWEHGSATGHDNIPVEVTTNVNVALHDGIETAECISIDEAYDGGSCAHSLVDAMGFESEHAGLEENLGSTEARERI